MNNLRKRIDGMTDAEVMNAGGYKTTMSARILRDAKTPEPLTKHLRSFAEYFTKQDGATVTMDSLLRIEGKKK